MGLPVMSESPFGARPRHWQCKGHVSSSSAFRRRPCPATPRRWHQVSAEVVTPNTFGVLFTRKFSGGPQLYNRLMRQMCGSFFELYDHFYSPEAWREPLSTLHYREKNIPHSFRSVLSQTNVVAALKINSWPERKIFVLMGGALWPTLEKMRLKESALGAIGHKYR